MTYWTETMACHGKWRRMQKLAFPVACLLGGYSLLIRLRQSSQRNFHALSGVLEKSKLINPSLSRLSGQKLDQAVAPLSYGNASSDARPSDASYPGAPPARRLVTTTSKPQPDQLELGIPDPNLSTLFNLVRIQKEREECMDGGPMEYLPNFRNPCWEAFLPSSYPYQETRGVFTFENYPGFRTEYAEYDFVKMREIFEKRLAGQESWRTRCVPYVYLIGVTKSGTTDLFANLVEHPDVVAGTYKEPQYWNSKVANRLSAPGSGRWWSEKTRPNPVISLSQYVDLYDKAAYEIDSHFVIDDGAIYHPKITVDASPDYFWQYDGWSSVPGNKHLPEPAYIAADPIKMLVPDARVLLMLREPVDRIYSHYRHKGSGSAEEFHKLSVQAIAEFNKCKRELGVRACAYNGSMDIPDSRGEKVLFLRASLYVIFLKDWLAVFQPQQILVIKADDYFADTGVTMSKVFGFLGLQSNATSVSHSKRLNSYNSVDSNINKVDEPIHGSTRRMLRGFFQPYNNMLAGILGDGSFTWR